MNSGKLALGVLAGIAIGGLFGVLFAPEKGTTMRRKISRKGEDYFSTLEDKFDDIVETLRENYESYKDDGEDFVENAKSKAKKEMKAAS
jgi:gas vesicle protein